MSAFDNIDLMGGSFGSSQDDFNSLVDSPQTHHAATVSPTELTMDNAELLLSSSASVAFPYLDTPTTDYFPSPDGFSSGFDTTPAFGDGALDMTLDFSNFESNPLFNDTEKQYSGEPAIVQNNSYGSLQELDTQPSQPSPMVRQKSSPGRPPIVHDRKASLSAGITKGNQKSRKDLPEITIDSEDDKDTAKRKKNTAAARKSRQRRQEAMSAMAGEIARLRAVVEALGGDPDMEVES